MQASLLLAIDQGTSSTKTIVFTADGQPLAKATVPLHTHYFDGGRVEQEPDAIYQNVLASVNECVAHLLEARYPIEAIAACGISNQRETFLVWDADGKPLHNAVVWQCKRSIEVCNQLKQVAGLEEEITAKTGLIIDPYFSGTKMIWLYQNVDAVKQAVDAGQAYFGTVDTWLLFKLSNGKAYKTDYTNASRTLFFNLHTLQWDAELLAKFGLSKLNLPQLNPSAAAFGSSTFEGLFADGLPITSLIGDSHAAAYGEGCLQPGSAKATLGTGCSVLMNIGDKPKPSKTGMMTTICYSTSTEVAYAYEGVIVSCGSTIEWIKNQLGLFAHSAETATMATAVPDNNGVYLIPAFSGLGAPHWDMARKAGIYGLTFDCDKNHIVRAALESIAYQIKDVADAMHTDAGVALNQLMVNGGITSNTFVLQYIANLLSSPVVNHGMPDASALGAALLAGLGAGIISQYPTKTTQPTVYAANTNSPAALQCHQQWLKHINAAV